MNEQETRRYFLAKPEAMEDYPFGPEVAVFKIREKMFGLLTTGEWLGQQNIPRINLKCDPDEACALRDIYAAVIPGYHMNKKHWNTIILNGSIPRFEIERMIDRSYGLVVQGLNKTERRALEIKYGEELYK